jgi:serine/threonine-protein kinase
MAQEHEDILSQNPAAGGAGDPLAGTGYRTVGRLGSGSVGDILDAIHVGLGKPVAVKLLRRAVAGDALLVERLRLEAEALGRLDHPNLVTVTDVGRSADGRPFFVMQRLQGRTLHAELRERGFIPVGAAIEMMKQLLSGLGAAHALGLVHRDLKPENVFLCDPVDGRRTLKVLDFSIAKVVAESASPATPRPLALCTAEGSALGTPRFLSPEQAMAREVDARADIYGAGVVLYEMIAGRDPFHHVRGHLALLQAHVLDAPSPPSSAAPQHVAPALDAVVLKALAKRPEDRFSSAADFTAALDDARCAAPAGLASRWFVTEAMPIAPRRRPETRSPRRAVSFIASMGIVAASALVSALLAALACRAL